MPTPEGVPVDPASVVVLLSTDKVFSESLASSLSQHNASIELQIITAPLTLERHLERVQPEAFILDLATVPHGLAAELVSEHWLAYTTTILLGEATDELIASAAGAVQQVPREGDIPGAVVQILRSNQRAVELDHRIQERVQHYRDILESSSDGIFVLLGGVFTYVNESFANSVGRRPRQLIGQVRLTDLVHDDDQHMLGEEISRLAVVGGKRELFEAQLLTAEGTSRRFEIACRSSVVDGRRAVVGVARDVTAVRELQEEIERARQRASQIERLRALGELAAGVAHDFNNTLETVLGRVQLARQKYARGESIEEDLDVLESAARDAASTVSRIQDYARPADGGSWDDVDIASVTRDTAEFIQTRVPQRIDLEVDISPTPPIPGNGAELREVVLNLLANALDAIEGTGRVSLRCYTDNQRAILEVEDTGCGIPADLQPRIYEPFFTTKGDAGTGLGLSVSHGILQRHGAETLLASTPGHGTRFRLVFTPSMSLPRPSHSLDKSSMSIAVIDDDSSVAELIKDLLEEMGHTVTLLEDIPSTIEFVSANEVDLLITDLDLPGASGWQLARSIRRVRSGILVGLITGWPIGASDDELKSRGVDFVLVKPFTLAALENALAGLRRA
jgi:PAS domain S-box-containing protein